MQCEEGTEWLLEMLTDIQLQQYFLRIRDELNVTRLSHFDYVKNEDLEKIGMGRPGRSRYLTSVLRLQVKCVFTNLSTHLIPVGKKLRCKCKCNASAFVLVQVRGGCGRPSRGEELFINASPG